MAEPTLQDFIDQVATPLVAGGEVVVGPPIKLEVARAWQAQVGKMGAPSTEALDRARRQAAELLVAAPPQLELDATGLALMLGLYEGLVLSHPDVGTSKKLRERILGTGLTLLRLPPPESQLELLSRHTVLARVVELSRKDTHLRWWTGKANFRGREVPRRLTRWKAVRRVRSFETRTTWLELVGDQLAEALLAASPLTRVLAAGWAGLRFTWSGSDPLFYQGGRELLRAVAYHGAAPGQGEWRSATASAWEALISRPSSQALAQQVTALLCYVGACAVEQGAEVVDLFAAIPALVAEAAPGWLAALEAGLPPRIRASWQSDAGRHAAALPAVRRTALVAALGQALGRSALSPAPAPVTE